MGNVVGTFLISRRTLVRLSKENRSFFMIVIRPRRSGTGPMPGTHRFLGLVLLAVFVSFYQKNSWNVFSFKIWKLFLLFLERKFLSAFLFSGLSSIYVWEGEFAQEFWNQIIWRRDLFPQPFHGCSLFVFITQALTIQLYVDLFFFLRIEYPFDYNTSRFAVK